MRFPAWATASLAASGSASSHLPVCRRSFASSAIPAFSWPSSLRNTPLGAWGRQPRLLDYFMPDLNGGEVASEMRRRRPGVPIVFLSAYFSLPPEALELADGFIDRGDPPDVLIDRIQQLL